MSANEKAPSPAKVQRPNQIEQANDTKTPTKKKRVLTALIDGQSFNRFEAERQLSDHVLNSTVADLQRLGITIARQLETVPGYRGLPTKVARYWISPEHRERAQLVLGRLR